LWWQFTTVGGKIRLVGIPAATAKAIDSSVIDRSEFFATSGVAFP